MREPIKTHNETPAPGDHVTVGPMGRPTRIHLKKGEERRGYVNPTRRRFPLIVGPLIIVLVIIVVVFLLQR